jgi:hypothetical protein
MAAGFELKPIERTDRNRGQLYAALDIYRQGVRPEEQNPERQILHWIDHRKDILADEFQCCTLNRGEKVVGYLQYSYFSEEHTFFLEYLCLQRDKRSGLGPPRELVLALKKHFLDNYRPNFTMVFEVAHEKLSNGKRVSDTKRLDYFERFGFRKIDYPYRYPVLQTYDGEISYSADLLVRLPDDRKEVTSAELRSILRCLYYKHYLRWDRPFLDTEQFSHRQKLIDDLYSLQLSQMGNQDRFRTEGDSGRLSIFAGGRYEQKISSLLSKFFGPKLPRLLAVIVALLILERYLNSVWLLVPFVLTAAVLYCIAEDSEKSTKMLSICEFACNNDPLRGDFRVQNRPL